MNKSLLTNLIAILLILAGLALGHTMLFAVGLFAASGAITNWLAVHMLFEKVPGLYGSGVIPANFENFKRSIKTLMMDQFFTEENIDRFLNNPDAPGRNLHLAPVIEKADFSPAFDGLVEVVEESSFGSLLGMIGGTAVLEPMREPFCRRMKSSVERLIEDEKFMELLTEELHKPDVMVEMRHKIESIVEQRLNELTPQLVKEMVQKMIREHLGWLVVWGGVFGGLIGLLANLAGYQASPLD